MDGADTAVADGGGDAVADGDAAPDKHSAFMQQRMAVWQPLMRPKFVIPWFILTGAGLLAAGLAILAAQSGLKSHGPIVYSSIANCSAALRNSPCSAQLDTSYGPNVGPDALKPLNPLCVPLGFDDDPTPTTGAESNVCRLEITLEEDWEGPVYLYYILTNFYQNHRLYVADRADNQLTGENSPSSGVMFTDLLSDLPYQGCTADALPGALFCTGTDDGAWLPVSYANSMGLSKAACEAAEPGGAHADPPFLCTARRSSSSGLGVPQDISRRWIISRRRPACGARARTACGRRTRRARPAAGCPPSSTTIPSSARPRRARIARSPRSTATTERYRAAGGSAGRSSATPAAAWRAPSVRPTPLSTVGMLPACTLTP